MAPFASRYFEHVLPLAPRSYERVLASRLDAADDDSARTATEPDRVAQHPHGLERPARPRRQDPERAAEREREKEVIKRRLGESDAPQRGARRTSTEHVRPFNGASWRAVTASTCSMSCFGEQAYRLATGGSRRRKSTTGASSTSTSSRRSGWRIRRCSSERTASCSTCCGAAPSTGFRIDHVDGLYDPRDYLQRLQARARELRPDRYGDRRSSWSSRRSSRPTSRCRRLAGRMARPATSSLNAVNGLFVDGRRTSAPSTSIYERFTGDRATFAELAYRSKQLILQVVAWPAS